MRPPPPRPAFLPLVRLALAEDLRGGDLTSELLLPTERPGRAVIEAREPLVVCGLPVVACVFGEVDPAVRFVPRRNEGERARPGETLAELEGPIRSLLAAERTALNFLGRLAGIATLTRRCVELVAGTRARIVDTRKTLPGWRVLDKYATAVGGATNHRFGLDDGILLKDNHVAAAGGVGPAVKRVLAGAPHHLRVQVEVESLAEAREAVEAGADFLLLDNLAPAEIATIVEELAERTVIEASGGIAPENLRAVAETGVHRISVGRLTHSAPAADVALEMRTGGASA